MASQQSKARRRAVAVTRLLEAQRRIGELFGTQVPALQRTNLDAELAQIQETESVADFLEAAWPAMLELVGQLQNPGNPTPAEVSPPAPAPTPRNGAGVRRRKL